jgi:Peptidase family S41/N-terminal domain of Peptidase_S41 in eukaryotic IRBP
MPFVIATATATALCAPADPPISDVQKRDVVAALARDLRDRYVFPDVAERAASELTNKAVNGAYASATTSQTFAKALDNDLRALGNDAHFRVRYAPDFVPRPSDDRAPTAEELAHLHDETLREGYAIARVERLPGNVGYLDLRGFGPTEFVADAYTSAIALLQGTDAMIIDLRRNGGGEPESVAYLLSHFFAAGDRRHINDIYSRPHDETQQSWTVPVKVHYLKPVYVLTSARTFSGGEECAYDFQTQKRATLVGETTGGGANPGDLVQLPHGIIAFIPTGRAINPITKTNWEHVGVKPDVAVPAAKAMQVAYAEILRAQIAGAKSTEAREDLQKVLTRVESGDTEAPNYAPPK